MKKILAVFLLSILIIVGCVTPLTQKGNSIKLVTHIDSQKCKSLGLISMHAAFGAHPGINTQNTLNRLKNKSALLGGNSLYLISNQTVGLLHGQSISIGEVLKCKTK